MQLSNRVTTLSGTDVGSWDIFLRSRQMIAAGKSVIELTIGEHDIGTDPMILDAMAQSTARGNTGYASVPGIKSLRTAVAKRFQNKTGTATTWENVLITPGAQAGLFAAHMATLNPGDTALYCDPYYTTYPGVLKSAGAIPKSIRTHADADFQPQRADIDAVVTGAKTLLINSPNNPTGVVYGRETLDMIAEVCTTHDLWLISDEVYDSQIWEGTHLSPRALPNMAERTLTLGSMSKSHAMTGSRIGWIIAPKTVITHLTELVTVTTFGVPGFIQDAALFALGLGASFEEQIGAPFRRRRTLGMEILKGCNAVKLTPSAGAMYLMLDIRATGLSGIEFANRLLDERHIAVMPGESFGAAAAGHIRVAMTVEDARFEKALKQLCDFTATLK